MSHLQNIVRLSSEIAAIGDVAAERKGLTNEMRTEVTALAVSRFIDTSGSCDFRVDGKTLQIAVVPGLATRKFKELPEQDQKRLVAIRPRWSEVVRVLKSGGMEAAQILSNDPKQLASMLKDLANEKPMTVAQVFKMARKLCDADRELLILSLQRNEMVMEFDAAWIS